jgi:hypothetical protein
VISGHEDNNLLNEVTCFTANKRENRFFSCNKANMNSTLTLILLTTTIVAPPSNASKWQMGFNSAFKGLNSTQRKKLLNLVEVRIRKACFVTVRKGAKMLNQLPDLPYNVKDKLE